jgi:hypothetical protein
MFSTINLIALAGVADHTERGYLIQQAVTEIERLQKRETELELELEEVKRQRDAAADLITDGGR